MSAIILQRKTSKRFVITFLLYLIEDLNKQDMHAYCIHITRQFVVSKKTIVCLATVAKYVQAI